MISVTLPTEVMPALLPFTKGFPALM